MTKKDYYFAVITKVPDDDDWNRAVGEIHISPKHRERNKHLAGCGILVSPDLNAEHMAGLFGKCLMKHRDQTSIDLTEEQIVLCLMPVFELGEIMIMNRRNDRTIPDGRKPEKWGVEFECFERATDAIKRAKEVVGE